MFTATLFIIPKTWDQTKCPSMDKYRHCGIYTHNGVLSGHKKQRNLAICDNMDGSWAHYVKQKKPDKDKQQQTKKQPNSWIHIGGCKRQEGKRNG